MPTTEIQMTPEHIGQMAGRVWSVLKEHGPQTYAQMVKRVDLPRDVVMLALGWLAREDKIDWDYQNQRRVTLK